MTIRCDRERPNGDGLHFVKIDLVGENGEIECNADTTLSVSVENGTLLAFGSANPATTERFADGKYRTYYGRALAVVKPESPDCVIRVCGEGLREACAKI